MSRVPRKPNLRIGNFPYWSSLDSRSDLIYLGWGLRDYGRHPSVNEGDRDEKSEDSPWEQRNAEQGNERGYEASGVSKRGSLTKRVYG